MIWNSQKQSVSGSVIPLGFILVVTVISLAIILINTTTIPALSKKAEVDAHRDVETDFIRMDSAVYRAATTDIPQPVVMGNRVNYPPHLEPLKTPTPRLQTVGPHNISFDNAVYEENLSAYNRERETNAIRFSRDYNYYTTARDFGYEHGLFYTQPHHSERGDPAIIVRDKQTIINDETITVIAIEGDISFSRPSPTQISVTPIESKKEHTTITNDSGESINVTLPTRVPKSEWETLLESEMVGNGGHVTNVTYSTTNPDTGADDGANYVTIELESGIEYDLNMYTVRVEKY